ncbi:MAG: ABC transporter ATP-binding protein, partial [Christensenellales bacterium]|jgi:ATP-binding cassette subfamily B multidrug efflux pump
LEVVMEVTIPFLMARLIDLGINAGDMDMVLLIGGILLALIGISVFFGILSGRQSAKAAAGLAKNLRRTIFGRVQDFSFHNIDKFSTASLVTRLTTDVTNVELAFQMVIRTAVRAPLMLIFALVMAVGINPEFSLIYLAMIPFLGGGLVLIAIRVHPIFRRVFRTYDKLNNVVQENLAGIRVVKSYVRENHEKEKFGRISQEIYQDFSLAEKILVLNAPLMQFAMYACILLVSWFGANAIVSATMTTGELMSLISYSMQILMSLMLLSLVFVIIIISRASAQRISEVLKEESDIQNGEHPVMQVKDGSIRFDKVDFSYAKEQDTFCLSGVDLTIGPGETVGIVGATGSSKSTLVQLIPRLYDSSRGSVSVGGVDVRQYDLDTLRGQVAMVLQKNVLFSGTIKENLRWGKEDATDEEMVRVCKLAQADEFIRSFPEGYDTYIEQGGTNVSGGQKQRLCIARALLKNPKILILDDSTSAVDTKTDALLRKAMREQLPDTTKLIITQRISSVQDADQIIVMEDGRIDAVGTHGQLLRSNEIYREVYTSQQKGGGADEAIDGP